MLININRLIRQTVQRHKTATAIVNIERRRRLSYLEIHRLTNKVCHAITGRFGLGPGDFYATLLENDHMVFFHPWMFKCPVTAAWLDIRESLQVQLRQIDQIMPRLVFIERHLLPELSTPLLERDITIIAMDRPSQTNPGLFYFWDVISGCNDDEVDAELAYEDVGQHTALLRFTGGTTENAKCAAYSLCNLWSWGMNPSHYIHVIPFASPRGMFFSPINHAASGSLIIPIFIKGGTVLTLNRADTEQIGQVIEEHQVQLIYAVPTTLYRMLGADLSKRNDLRSLQTVRYGGAPISPSKLEELLDQFGNVFVQGYGSSECWPSATLLPREEHVQDNRNNVMHLNSVGQAVSGEELVICDEEGHKVPTGQKGEIYIRGANTISGYYRAPKLTMQHFTSNGFWKSGDIGYMDEDGFIYIIDRKKDMIITGGYNVYASEVENCLNSHPRVKNSAVVGLPDDTWGEAVHAMIVLKNEESVSEEELVAFCKQKLARHKAPKFIEIVHDLPLSPAGKVLRREVRQLLLRRH